MSNLMIKNGYNGSHRRYGERVSKETRQKCVCDSKRSIHFPAIIHRDKQTVQRQVKAKSPQDRAVGISPDSDEVGLNYSSYSPSLVRDDFNECLILFPDEISELRHLAVALGIESRKSRGVLVREMESRWSPVKESNGEQWWKNSKKWIKHIEEQEVPSGHMHEAYKQSPKVTQTKREELKTKNEPGLYNESDKDEVYNALPENVKRKIRSVVIPGIGCSYRLPTIDKKQKK